MKKRYITVLLLLFAISLQAQTQLSDSAKISLITTSPWDGAIYSVYGHTALYVEDDSTGVNLVFNYGYFDGSQSNFIYRFMRGETDYVLGVNSYSDFFPEYEGKGVEVAKQELSLSPKERQELWNALYLNSLPENRKYRYNFLFDNCATRPRDVVEKHVRGKIVYQNDNKSQTFRDLIHECVDAYPWMKFGIDLIIGSDADREITVREKMFLPKYLKDSFAEAVISDTINVPLISKTTILSHAVNKPDKKREWVLFSPISIAFVLLLVSILISTIQYVKWSATKLSKIYDTLLFFVAGVAGIIVFFMICFSEHPATNPNWNFVWLNIFAFIFAFLFWVKPMKNAVNIYHFINFAVLTLFLLFWWWIPQQLPAATIPFSMSLWLRSGTNIYMLRRRRLKNRQFTTSRHLKAGWGGL